MKESDIKEVLSEIEQHNESWFQDIYERNKDNLDAPSLWYRGTNISYQEMLKEANRYAKSLRKLGIKQGDEVSACLSNTPELIYLLLAISMLGAKINLFGSQFDQDYIKKIIDDCSSKVFFATDCQYEDIKNITLESSIEKIVL
ncbi:MAG: acyl--CoA ligase, partial [Bacilli bacterium]|nr:acyl--CoA ligase [Bacilli bacterium]